MIAAIQAELDAIASDVSVRVVILAAGLVNRVVPSGRLDTEIRRFTDIILARSSATIRLGKQAFCRQIDHPLAAAYDIASEMMACNMLFDDAAEGIAFLQKRPASWRGK